MGSKTGGTWRTSNAQRPTSNVSMKTAARDSSFPSSSFGTGRCLRSCASTGMRDGGGVAFYKAPCRRTTRAKLELRGQVHSQAGAWERGELNVGRWTLDVGRSAPLENLRSARNQCLAESHQHRLHLHRLVPNPARPLAPPHRVHDPGADFFHALSRRLPRLPRACR